MTTAQLGRRMGVSQSRAVAIEQAETRSSITLETLERAARALDCELVYALVPRRPLDELVEERARRVARHRLAPTCHSMALEAQGVDKDDDSEQLARLVRSLAERSGSELWEEDK